MKKDRLPIDEAPLLSSSLIDRRGTTWTEMLSRTGIKSQHISPYFTEAAFPLCLPGLRGWGAPPPIWACEYDLVLIRLDRLSTARRVLEEIDRRTLWRPDAADLMSFAAAYPAAQHAFRIVAFVETADRSMPEFVPFLDHLGRNRELGVQPTEQTLWVTNTRLLARKLYPLSPVQYVI